MRRFLDRRGDIIRFGNDGWHARFDDGLNEANVVRVADALASLWAEARPGATVYVGFDTRHLSREHAHVAAAVFSAHGLRARVSQQPCPTPAVAWSCAHDPQGVGALVLTASERSCEYGGLLVRGADGGPMDRDFLDQVEQAVRQAPVEERGAYEECDLMAGYRAALLAGLDREAIARRAPKVVVDPMYGAAGGHLSSMLSGLGCRVVEIHVEPREDFAGIHPDPQDPWADACEQAVVAHGADLGLLLDGDGDRAAVVDERGAILPPRALIPLVLGHLVSDHDAHGRVVSTLTCSACVSRQARRLGLDQVVVPVGFSRIYREVVEGGVLLGAEEYGGISVPAHLPERDGLLVCLLAVEMACQQGRPLSQMVCDLEQRVGTMRYARRDVRLEPAHTQAFRNVLPGLNPHEVAGRVPVEVSHADGLRLQFDDDSWVLMRPSRAGSVVRVYAEAGTERDRDDLLRAACDIVRATP